MSRVQPGAAMGGVLLYSAGVFFFAVNDALGKWLVADYSVAQLMAVRAVGAVVVLAPALWISRGSLRPPRQVWLQVARVATSAIDTGCFYFATKSLPLADVMTFYLAAPLIVVALSSAVLGERVGLNRWAAVALGFVGVLIALRPTGAVISPGALIALAGSLMFALTITITRRLRATHWLQLVAYQVVGSGIAGGCIAPFAWVWPGAGDLGLMFLVGIVSMACFMCITKALRSPPRRCWRPSSTCRSSGPRCSAGWSGATSPRGRSSRAAASSSPAALSCCGASAPPCRPERGGAHGAALRLGGKRSAVLHLSRHRVGRSRI